MNTPKKVIPGKNKNDSATEDPKQRQTNQDDDDFNEDEVEFDDLEEFNDLEDEDEYDSDDNF